MGEGREAPTTIISLEGTFDLPAARLLENSIKRLRRGDRVLVDFEDVRLFKDFAVAVLAQALKDYGAGVRVEGLRLHQIRLLRYFGVGPEVFRPPADPRTR